MLGPHPIDIKKQPACITSRRSSPTSLTAMISEKLLPLETVSSVEGAPSYADFITPSHPCARGSIFDAKRDQGEKR